MKDIQFQKNSIAKLANNAVELLQDRFQDNSRIIFQAPTGSGKTYMISQALTEIVKQCGEPFSFFWISVNSLHEQSLDNLNRYLEDERLLECITVDEIIDNSIDQNQIVFFNWESLIKKNNIFRLDNERDWTLKNVSQNTKDEGRRIILIIDESHKTANAANAREVIAEIGPALTIEMTATPVHSPTLKIPLPEVISEGLIKKGILINPEGKSVKENRDLLELALKKRQSLQKQYADLGTNINPLRLFKSLLRKSQTQQILKTTLLGYWQTMTLLLAINGLRFG
ncbi:MAG: DEAD/DEAH box helicase family protein [Acidobacteria bacterium]|nr:DEAD/DEAH box helicase family protein [Acidobacteriota bacterium]